MSEDQIMKIIYRTSFAIAVINGLGQIRLHLRWWGVGYEYSETHKTVETAVEAALAHEEDVWEDYNYCIQS